MALLAFKNIGSIEDRAERSLKKHKREFERWVVKLAVLVLSISISLACLTLGLFFIAMDDCGIPRGVVFIGCGLLGLLVLRLLLPSTK